MITPDENGATHATKGRDPVSGLEYIIDARTKDRVYQLAQCQCGRQPWSSVPSHETVCPRCKIEAAQARGVAVDERPQNDNGVGPDAA